MFEGLLIPAKDISLVKKYPKKNSSTLDFGYKSIQEYYSIIAPLFSQNIDEMPVEKQRIILLEDKGINLLKKHNIEEEKIFQIFQNQVFSSWREARNIAVQTLSELLPSEHINNKTKKAFPYSYALSSAHYPNCFSKIKIIREPSTNCWQSFISKVDFNSTTVFDKKQIIDPVQNKSYVIPRLYQYISQNLLDLYSKNEKMYNIFKENNNWNDSPDVLWWYIFIQPEVDLKTIL